jgi:flagellar biosynthesis protein FlhG
VAGNLQSARAMMSRLEPFDGGKDETGDPNHPANLTRPRCRSLAVTSGKGGVGKTNVAANLALALAARNRRILLVDGDVSLANLDLLLGAMPSHNVADAISGRMPLEDVIVSTYRNIRLVPAASGDLDLANLDDFRRECFLRSLSKLDGDTDLMLIDTGAGIAKNVTSLALAADEILVVTTPEPTSVSQAYAMIKILAVYRQVPPLKVLVNMAKDADQALSVYNRICKVSAQFLRSTPEYWGHIEEDAAVRRAVSNQEPFVLSAPQSAAAQAIERLAQRVLDLDPEPRKTAPTHTGNEWLHRLKQRAG